MAGGVHVVLCTPLCFLVKKFSNTPAKMLKSALLDFYDGQSLSTAKQQLLKDFNDIGQQVRIESLPHIPLRREGDNRAQREVDDMFTMLNALDEHLVMNKLPTYVTDNPDNLPSTRLYEGDFSVIMGILEKMEEKLNTFGSALFAISRDVYAIQSKSTVSTVQPTEPRGAINERPDKLIIDCLQAWPGLPAHEGAAGNTQVQSDVTSCRDSTVCPILDSAACTQPVMASESTSANDVMNKPLRKGTQWSALVSTPQASSNRFAALASTDDDDNNDDNDDRPYTISRSQRRAATKRDREQSGRQPNPQTQRQRTQVTGQLSTESMPIWAAKKTIKKAVLCVDNVDLACNEDDMHTYVTGLGVKVFTCFKTNPRRRPNETAEDVSDRKAFRLCVNAADRGRLLNAKVCPDSVRISDWFFRNKNNQLDNDDK